MIWYTYTHSFFNNGIYIYLYPGGSTLTTLTISVGDHPPADLSYSDPTPIYVIDSEIDENILSATGGVITGLVIDPELPEGLEFDTTTGSITGSASELQDIANFTVTATNSGGSATFTLLLTVIDNPPLLLSYSDPSPIYEKDSEIIENTPTNTGGDIVSYTISPDLPAGVNMDTITGVISGTPTELLAELEYTITGINSGGSVTVTLPLIVNDIPPLGLSYTWDSHTLTIDDLLPDNNATLTSGGAVVSFEIVPSLPAGVNIDTTTGITNYIGHIGQIDRYIYSK